MNRFAQLYIDYMPNSVLPIVAGMLGTGFFIVIYFVITNRNTHHNIKNRLAIASTVQIEVPRKKDDFLSEKTIKKAEEFYVQNDPNSVVRLRMQLIQAGYMQPNAVGVFFASRVIIVVTLVIFTFSYMNLFATDSSSTNTWICLIIAAIVGYVLPSLWVSYQQRSRLFEYRNGFPDFLDLMIVCSDAGLSMDAAIERISREIEKSHASLSENLKLLSIELRAGRDSNAAMKSLGERMKLDEVRAFAILIQQSRELGTSLSATLRVFSDEMRHKRMSKAEEKAHALPAKMSVVVTLFILPMIVLLAIIPVIVKLMYGM
jgi:tight adherence protein C